MTRGEYRCIIIVFTMSRVVLQVPMTVGLRKSAEVEALSQGFSSLQEAVRVFLKKLASQEIAVGFEKSVKLSPRAVKRYNKIVD